MKRPVTCISMAITMALLSSSLTALAADPRASTAGADLKKEGDAAMLAGKYEVALSRYEAALARSSDPALHFNRGAALERLHRFADAIRAYEQFVTDASPELAAKATELPIHVAELRKKTATLKFVVQPEGARIWVGGIPIGQAPLAKPFRVDAGRVRIEVAKDGFASEARTMTVPANEEVVVSFVLPASGKAPTSTAPGDSSSVGSPASLGSPGAPATSADAAPSSGSILGKWWFWTGVGAVAAAGAVTIIVLTRPDEGKGDIEPGRITAPLMRF